MPFIKVSGLCGKVYVPQPCSQSSKKHPCRDCFDCQQCRDDRCSLCRNTGSEQEGSKEEPDE